MTVLVGLALAACSAEPGDPEARLRETIAAAEAAAEAGDADALVALIARDYSDLEGRDRRTVGLMIRGLLARYPSLELVVTVRELELFSPVLAQVEIAILAAGAGAGRWSADGFRLTAAFRDDGDGWRVTSARWDGGRGI